MHFFSPANVMKLLEVVRGEKTAKDVLATAMRWPKIGKTAGAVSACATASSATACSRSTRRRRRFLLEEGATPQQVDKAIERSASRWARSA